MSNPLWQCEECGKLQAGEPALVEKAPGYGGPVELRFCEGCADE